MTSEPADSHASAAADGLHLPAVGVTAAPTDARSSQREVDTLAGSGTLSVDGFVYVDASSQAGATGDDDDDVDATDAEALADAEAMDVRHRQLMYAIHSLKMYNPDFNLTPEVLEIMRVFFDDMHPDDDGTISLRAVFAEIERLDPEMQLLSEETRQLLWRDISGNSRDASERIDFHGFCAWVMRWKEISPVSVRNMYTSWAQQIAMIDFGLHEADGVFVVRSEELPPSDVLKTEISKLLKARQRVNPHLSRKHSNKPRVAAASGANNADSGADHRSVDTGFVDANVGRMVKDGIDDKGEEFVIVSAKPAPSAAVSEADGSMKTVSKSFIAGGAAGIVAKSMLAPVDRVKIMFQVNDKRHFSFRNALNLAREIYVQDGFRALFRGNMLNILRVVPYAGVQHSSFDFFRRKFHAYNFAQAEKKGADEQFQKLSNLQLVTAGSLAGGLSLVMAYPLDIVRARYMVQQGKHQYQTLYEAVASMYKLEGARSFSRGLVPSLMGTLPYTGIGFALNEKFKGWMVEFKYARLDAEARADAPRLHPFSKFLCSYFAACIAQTATYPMDTIRRRIQTDGFVPGTKGELRYTGVATTARIIIAQEGWRGFFKGVSVNWMRLNEYLSSIWINDDDPGFVLDWDMDNLNTFVVAANGHIPARAPAWLRMASPQITAKSFADDLVHKLEQVAGGRYGRVLLAPNRLDQFLGVAMTLVALQDNNFLQDDAQVALPLVNNVEQYLATTYYITVANAQRSQSINLQTNCPNEHPLRRLFI